MKKTITLLLFFIAFWFNASAQGKAQPAASMPSLVHWVGTTKLPYKFINDSLIAIPFEGEHIPSYNVVVQGVGDLVIVFTNLSQAAPGKLDASRHAYLLQMNEHYDLVKIGLGLDSSFYVRADVFRTALSNDIISRIIKQVANVTNIIAGELKQ